ncbi:MAG TPA: GAF domain-containing sensor histidine kinase [Candidatus Saccharimonadales bacterium]|nr:GAF domain-containing sensor histidine kinase [Candidatus Saccharimonadales bacterium]
MGKVLFFQAKAKQRRNQQTVAKSLNQAIASEVVLPALMRRSLAILARSLDVEQALFVTFHDDQLYRVEAHGGAKVTQQELATLAHFHEDLVRVDAKRNAHLSGLLAHLGMNVAVRLRLSGQTLGFVLLGPRKRGNKFTAADLELLDMAARQLAPAVRQSLTYEQLLLANLELQKRVDEANHKLSQAKQKLRTLDETKDDFISMASHQLRTPLTSVKGYLSLLLEGDAGKLTPTQREMLGQAFFSSQRMVYLIADLLNVSRIKTGRFVIESSPVNLAAVVQEEVEQLQETAAVRQLKLTYDKPKEFPDLMLDETKIRQVIMNFVDNAIYYTPAGGHIQIELSQNSSSVQLEVIDNGIGVPKPEQHHLFTKFYRATNARQARPDGTGLGLYMAKKVVAAQGGSVVMHSQEGEGSSFGFILSKAKLAVPASAATKPGRGAKTKLQRKAKPRLAKSK